MTARPEKKKVLLDTLTDATWLLIVSADAVSQRLAHIVRQQGKPLGSADYIQHPHFNIDRSRQRQQRLLTEDRAIADLHTCLTELQLKNVHDYGSPVQAAEWLERKKTSARR